MRTRYRHSSLATLFSLIFLLLPTLLVSPPLYADEGAIARELDAYWSNVARYLASGDYDGLASTYHPDAVLVSEHLGTSYPISRALERWKPGILDTAAGKAVSLVEFRITRRLFSETTSHEQGIFHFRSGPAGDDVSEADFAEDWVHFEALLLKNGNWTMVMEYQKHPATQAEWEAAASAVSAPAFDPEGRLAALGIALPPAPRPVASYVNGVQTGNLVFLAGKGPRHANGREVTGKLGAGVTIEEGYEAARLTAINQLAVLKDMLGDLRRVKRVVKVLGMVNSDPAFIEQPAVINGFSDLIVEVFGERGRHARAAVGMASLPRGQAVEIEMVVEIEDSPAAR